MAKKSKNIFYNATQAHETERGKLTATAMSTRPVGEKKTKITLSISQKDSDAAKMYAIKQHKTVSDLLHEWIATNCEE